MKNRTNPFFSVLVPSYERPIYLKECIDSILKNDYKNYEVVISDDHSSKINEIEATIEPYLIYENIRFIKQPRNLGMSDNWNFLVEQAKGEFIIMLGDDDKLYPHSLSRIKKYIDNFPDYDLYGFGYSVIDENSNLYYSRRVPKSIELSLQYPRLIKSMFISDMFPFWIYHPLTICYKKSIRDEVKYSKDALIGSDFLFLFDCMNKGKKMFIIPEVLFYWRKIQNESKDDSKNISLIGFNNLKARRNIYYLLQNRTDLDPTISTFISGIEYRRRFLYNAIIFDRTMDRSLFYELDLDEYHLNELINYSEELKSSINLYKSYIIRMLNFIRLFGVRGAFSIIKVASQRIYYRFAY